MQSVRAVFEEYRQAIEAGDVESVAAAYDLPLSVTRPDRTATVSDRKTLRHELQKILDTWLWMGMDRVEIAHFEEVGFGESMGIVNLTWRLFDAEDTHLTDVDTTYTLRVGGGRPLIAAVTPHNEEERRMPRVRAARETAERR